MGKRTKGRPAPKKVGKKRPKLTIKKHVVVKRRSRGYCNHFACKEFAVKLGYCTTHALTPEDLRFRERINNWMWLMHKGMPAIRKLLQDFPPKRPHQGTVTKVAHSAAMH